MTTISPLAKKKKSLRSKLGKRIYRLQKLVVFIKTNPNMILKNQYRKTPRERYTPE
jgi:hypothetical protein